MGRAPSTKPSHSIDLPPGDFVDFDGFADAAYFGGRQFDAAGGKGGVLFFEVEKSGFANEDAANAGEFFKAAGNVHVAAKDGVVLGVLRAHEAGVNRAGVDAGADGKNVEEAQTGKG